MRNPRIKIRKKEAEWEKLKIVLSSFQYQTDFKKFIALKARHLVAQYKKDPASIIKLIAGETRQELIPLDGETYRSLREISKPGILPTMSSALLGAKRAKKAGS